MCQSGACKCGSRGHKMAKAAGLLALRIALGIIFLYQGYMKIGPNHTMATGMMAHLIGPSGAGAFWAYLVGGLEILGGLMVILGVYTNFAAVWLSIIIVVAMITAHPAGSKFPSYFLELAVLGGTLALCGNGAGKFRLVKTECRCKKCMGEMPAKAGCGCSGNCNCGNAEKMCACGGTGACACKKDMLAKETTASETAQ